MSGILIATATIETGDLVDGSMMKAASWPTEAIPEGAMRSVDELKDVVYARGLILPGEPIMREKLDDTGAVLTLAASITPGMRAVSVVVGNDTGVAGFVLPGDRVDVNEFLPLETLGRSRVSESDGMRTSGDLVARSVLKNVKVLAVDQTFDPGLEGALPSNTVTLEVTPAGALTLGAASQRNALGLSLIGRKEEAVVVAEERKEPVRRVVRAAPVRRAPSTTTVRVINGDAETKVTAPVAKQKETKEEAS
jgi:pilus assembly protein CpaB